MGKRRRFSSDFKATRVIESLKGEKSQATICREHDLSPELLRQWKKLFLERAHLIFDETKESSEQARIAELERLVGKLTLELSVLKKVSTLLESP